jgi:ABC-type phosphate transport system ATPase subunit
VSKQTSSTKANQVKTRLSTNSLGKALSNKMKMSKRSLTQNPSPIIRIDEETSSYDGVETADLVKLNQELREQVMTQVALFE